QAIGPLPTGVVEGRGQGVHREDRLSHPGRTDAVNPVLVNRYVSAARHPDSEPICEKPTVISAEYAVAERIRVLIMLASFTFLYI
ncbi:hypothetical protein, partial [Aeromonas caviae]|uniref:hypothetical protein n=1 Tax=Aeromonas caviae TaxID=648 RepID=UPI001F38D01B